LKISVVIPCYNDGALLTEAVDSVLACSYPDLELIIVDDGSTDEATLNILNSYREKNFNILSHTNKGLAYSRNRGIQQARGTYILPLDADNKIKEGYLSRSVELLDSGHYDIVYAKPHFFGEDIAERKFVTHEFDGDKLFVRNYIDACAVYRKPVWEAVGGYDEKMPSQGNEDWEFWLHCHVKGFRFKFLDECLFDYRITKSSMIANVSSDQTNVVKNYLIVKHADQYREQFSKLNNYKLFYQHDQRNYLKTSFKYFIRSIQRLFTVSKKAK